MCTFNINYYIEKSNNIITKHEECYSFYMYINIKQRQSTPPIPLYIIINDNNETFISFYFIHIIIAAFIIIISIHINTVYPCYIYVWKMMEKCFSIFSYSTLYKYNIPLRNKKYVKVLKTLTYYILIHYKI